MLEGKERLAERIMAKLIAFLVPRVNYDLKQKLLVVEEVLAQHDPYEYVGDMGAYAKLTLFKDYRGEVIPTEHQDDRVKNGEYLLALIELSTSNWRRFSINWLEHNLAHELLHVVDPQLGMYVKNGRMWENERLMRKTTFDLLRTIKRQTHPRVAQQ
jgi:hypothetical protein